MVDALANLASNSPYPYHVDLNVLAHSSISKKAILMVETRTDDSWITPLTVYFKEGVLPGDKKVVVKIRAQATRYALINGTLYRKTFSSPYQRYVPLEEAEDIIKQTHKGICDTHIGRRSLCHIIMKQGFY